MVDRDPVCGMEVDLAQVKHKLTHEGREFGFCAAGCKQKFEADPDQYLTAKDPVCGMDVDRASANHLSKYEGQRHYFCGPSCKEKFEADPLAFLGDSLAKPAHGHVPQGTKWICPMDPEVEAYEFGDCPKCGMALEPQLPDFSQPMENPELKDFTFRFWVSAGLTVPLLILTMGDMFGLGVRAAIGENLAGLFEFVLTLPILFWAALPLLKRAWSSVRTRNSNMWTLIGLGSVAAFAFSTLNLFFPQLLPGQFLKAAGGDDAGHVSNSPLYFEAVAVIITLVFLGQVLELRARARTGDALRALMELAPRTARLITKNGIEEVDIDRVKVGDRLQVRAGDRFAVDGLILSGETRVDESMLTGESMPVEKAKGDQVSAGTLNGSGLLEISASQIGGETKLAQIVALVAQAQRSRAPIQTLVDRMSGWFVPLVILASVFSFVFWLAFGPDPKLSFAIITAVSVLVIACPCALGLATPMSVMVAAGKGAQSGILIKEAAQLERLSEIDVLIADKTGTLTLGQPKIVQLATENSRVVNMQELGDPAGWDDEVVQLLEISGALEAGSSHPIAKAINEASAALELPQLKEISEDAGAGMVAQLNGEKVAIGSRDLMRRGGFGISESLLDEIAGAEQSGQTIVFVGRGKNCLGFLAIADGVKPGALEAVNYFKEQNIEVIMASGDAEAPVRLVAKELRIAQAKSLQNPQDKFELVERLQGEGKVVGMIGDGINDGPALAKADIGMAVGEGAHVALESAGIVLTGGDISSASRAHRLGKAMVRNIKQNLVFAFGYNALGVPLAMGLLYPVFGWLLSPMFAAAAMSLSSVSVIANALRLGRVRL